MTASTAMVYDHDGSMDVMDGGSYSFYPRIVDEGEKNFDCGFDFFSFCFFFHGSIGFFVWRR